MDSEPGKKLADQISLKLSKKKKFKLPKLGSVISITIIFTSGLIPVLRGGGNYWFIQKQTLTSLQEISDEGYSRRHNGL